MKHPLEKACWLVAAWFLIGCSSNSLPPTYPVVGKVTMKGRPVEGATIILLPSAAGGQPATAISNAAGEFKMTTFTNGDGAQAGKYGVKVFKYENNAADSAKMIPNPSYEEQAANSTAGPENLLPKKYESEASSGIVHTVADAPTTLEIKIE